MNKIEVLKIGKEQIEKSNRSHNPTEMYMILSRIAFACCGKNSAPLEIFASEIISSQLRKVQSPYLAGMKIFDVNWIDSEIRKLEMQRERNHIFRLFGVTVWASNYHPEYGWFRIFGRGLTWKHENRGLIFSERNGYKKYIKLGRWIIGYLPKTKI